MSSGWPPIQSMIPGHPNVHVSRMPSPAFSWRILSAWVPAASAEITMPSCKPHGLGAAVHLVDDVVAPDLSVLRPADRSVLQEPGRARAAGRLLQVAGDTRESVDLSSAGIARVPFVDLEIPSCALHVRRDVDRRVPGDRSGLVVGDSEPVAGRAHARLHDLAVLGKGVPRPSAREGVVAVDGRDGVVRPGDVARGRVPAQGGPRQTDVDCAVLGGVDSQDVGGDGAALGDANELHARRDSIG